MARLRLEKISLIVNCDCKEQFVAEDLEPVCPFCNKAYKVSVSSIKNRLHFKIIPKLETAEARTAPEYPLCDHS